MPVPAPRIARFSSHPIIKVEQPGDVKQFKPVLNTTANNLPFPTRVPAKAAAEKRWSGAMDSWAAQRPRRIWEDDSYGGAAVDDRENDENLGFQSGLTGAANALVTKGSRAQAPFPPLFPSLSFGAPTSYERCGEPIDEDEYADLSGQHYVDASEWSYDEGDVAMEDSLDPVVDDTYGPSPAVADEYDDARRYLSPLLEDLSPIAPMDPMSSPGPLTPFAEYIDRAMPSAEGGYARRDHAAPGASYRGKGCGPHCQGCRADHDYERERAQAPAPSTSTLSANDTYRKLADPMSEWLASYVWKVCTTGMNLPSVYAANHSNERAYASSPPFQLASSIRSLLLSTLLQPSAIFLALKYITCLPVFVGPMLLDDAHFNAVEFRRALLGPPDAADRVEREVQAPYHVMVLGFMLANKWLDDHTFSNKTWHTISNIPLRTLNEIEARALTVLEYDLSIQPADWSLWLSHTLSYHTSLASSQPISRPSSSPHTIVRKAIEEVADASEIDPCYDDCCSDEVPQPVFIGLEARQREKEEAWEVEMFDPDEDGPLPEQYQRKRRTSRDESTRRRLSQTAEKPVVENSLPPPAKWSPAADELFVRDSSRYAVPQAGLALGAPRVPMVQATYAPAPMEPHYQWQSGYPSDKHFTSAFQPSTFQVTRDVYGYPVVPTSHGHTRSQSYVSGAGYGNVRVSPPETTWHAADFRAYAPPPYYQPIWGRA